MKITYLTINNKRYKLVPSPNNRLVLVPEHLFTQAKPWFHLLDLVQKLVRDRVLVTSVIDSLNGVIRSGSSHPNGWAIDLCFPDRVKHKDENPRFDNDLRLLFALSTLEDAMPGYMMAVESDHIHMEKSPYLQGTYIYSYMRPEHYKSDRVSQPRTIPDRQLITVKPTSISVQPDTMNKMMKQRTLTESNVHNRK